MSKQNNVLLTGRPYMRLSATAADQGFLEIGSEDDPAFLAWLIIDWSNNSTVRSTYLMCAACAEKQGDWGD